MLSQLMRLHQELDDWFALHQEALLELRFDLAGEALAAYVRLLRTHMRQEEELVLPAFDRLGPPPRWPRVLYTGQHEKMQSLLESAGNLVVELRALSGSKSERRRGALRLLAQEATYTHLVEHHDGAERDGLYAIVDRGLPADEQARILERCLREWAEATERERPLADRIRSELG